MIKRPVSISGKQQRPTFGDPAPTPFALLKADQARLLVLDGIQPQAPAWVWGLEINGQTIPHFENEWIKKVEKTCPAVLSGELRQQLKVTIETYQLQRFALATSVSHRSLTDALSKIENTARALLDAIEIHDQSNVVAWQAIEAAEHPALKRDDVYPVISKMVRHSYIAAQKARSQTDRSHGTFDPRKVWKDFAEGLRSVFEANGWEVKISKSQGNAEGMQTKHPSVFVNFAWAAIGLIPKELQEHTSSRWTLADALHSVYTKKNRSSR